MNKKITIDDIEFIYRISNVGFTDEDEQEREKEIWDELFRYFDNDAILGGDE